MPVRLSPVLFTVSLSFLPNTITLVVVQCGEISHALKPVIIIRLSGHLKWLVSLWHWQAVIWIYFNDLWTLYLHSQVCNSYISECKYRDCFVWTQMLCSVKPLADGLDSVWNCSTISDIDSLPIFTVITVPGCLGKKKAYNLLKPCCIQKNCTYRPVPAPRFWASFRTCKRLFCPLLCTALLLWWWW